MDKETGILDHLAVIVRWRRLIVTSFLAVSIATAIVTMFLPKAYRATAVVFPPSQGSDVLGGLSGLAEDLPLGLLGIGGGGLSATEFVPVLRSERIAMAVAERFDLKNAYQVGTRAELLMAISGRLETELSREQFLSVSYEAATPEAAAAQTNAFVEELNKTLLQKKKNEAGSLRAYFETRLAEAEVDIAAAEQKYKQFQKTNMAIDLESQAKAQIETAGILVSSLAEQIIKKEVASRMMEANNPTLKRFEIEVDATRKAVDRLLMGASDGQTYELPEIVIPFRDVPDLGLEALRLMRDIEIQNAIYKFVRQEYEKSKLEEDKEIAQVVVLDEAVAPDLRSKPRRTILVLLAGGLSLILSVLFAYVVEALGNMDASSRDKLTEIKREFSGS